MPGAVGDFLQQAHSPVGFHLDLNDHPQVFSNLYRRDDEIEMGERPVEVLAGGIGIIRGGEIDAAAMKGEPLQSP